MTYDKMKKKVSFTKKKLAIHPQSVILILMNDQDITLPSFDDLDFKPHANVPNAVMAKLTLGQDDQFEISVVAMNGEKPSFGGLYGDASNDTYEVAMFYRDSMLPLAKYDDVIGWQSPTDITKLMRQAILNDFAWVCLLRSIRDEHNKEMELDNPHKS